MTKRRTSTDVQSLERQVERGSFFSHTALGKGFLRLHELESFVYGLLDVLVTKQAVTSDEVALAVHNVRSRLSESGDVPNTGVVMRVDPTEEAPRPPTLVNCAERMHVCHAICCKLDFPLTVSEIESGAVKWDLGRPYYIRHEASGFCAHNMQATGGCGIYANRPAVCRGYSCANDQRIWKDFDKMELNTEWLSANLSGANGAPQFMQAMVRQVEG